MAYKKHKNLLYFIGLLIVMNILGPLLIIGLQNLINLTYDQQNLIWLLSIPLICVLAIFFTIKIFNIKLELNWIKINPLIIYYSLFLILLVYILQTAIDKPFLDGLTNGKLRFIKFNLQFQRDLQENIYLIVSVLTGPLLEELLFRRIIFRKLLDNYTVPVSIVLTSLLFAVIHQSIEGFLAYFFVGFVYTYLYHLTKNLWLNVMVHILFNILASVTIIQTYFIGSSYYFVGFIIYLVCGLGIFIIFKKIKNLST